MSDYSDLDFEMVTGHKCKCRGCIHCIDEHLTCDCEDTCINSSMFEEKEPKEKFNEIEK